MRKAFFKIFAVAGMFGALAWTVAQERNESRSFVALPMIVIDPSNHSVEDVSPNDLEVFEDGHPQKLVSVVKETKPVAYIITIDNSASFKDLLGNALGAGKQLVNMNNDNDETQLVRFVSSDLISIIEKFTSDRPKLLAALDYNWFYLQLGQTAVIDAAYLSVKASAEYASPTVNARRAVVLITDGEDRRSYYSIDDLVKLLRAKEVQVFAIGIVVKLDKESGFIKRSPREAAEKLLNRIAAESGGRVFFPKNVSELTEATKEIGHDLRTQFVVTYERLDVTGQTGFRKVQVKIIATPDRKLTAITRPHLRLNPQNDTTGKKEKKSQ